MRGLRWWLSPDPVLAVRPTGGGRTTLRTRTLVALVAATHPVPALAVTVLSALLCLPAGLSPARAAVVVAAVLTGQLSIGWSNDLVDARRDAAVGRRDKPLATGAVPEALVRAACGGAVAATVVLSLASGLAPGLLHLLLVAAGWAYNLGLKATAASWLPYAVAFGILPVFVWAAGGGLPAGWVVVAGALLGVGAHLLNAVPDLADDAATGVRGLPHRLGATASRVTAALLLATASVVLTVGATSVPAGVRLAALLLVAALSVAAVTAPGRQAFRAAIAIAGIDVVMLVVSS